MRADPLLAAGMCCLILFLRFSLTARIYGDDPEFPG